jgi:hypothetical protein
MLGVCAIVSTATISSLVAALRRRESYLHPDVHSDSPENLATYLFILLWIFLVAGSHVALCISLKEDQGGSGLAGVYKIESRNGSKFGRSKGLGVAGVYVLTGAVQREAGA